MASRPVPAEGSSTRSAAVIAAAMLADEAERDRRRELLERLALFRSARVRRQQGRDLRQHGEQRRRRAGAGTHGGTELAQEQHLRRLAGVVGGLPVPGAFGIGAAEAPPSWRSRSAWASMARPRSRSASRQLRGNHERGGRVGQARWRGRSRERGRRGEERQSWEMSGRAGTG